MTDPNWIGIVALGALLFLVCSLVASSRLPAPIKLLIYAGLGLRVVGAIARHEILFEFYDGVGDARGYFGIGLEYARSFRQLDFSILFDSSEWHAGTPLGTQAIRYLSGAILSLLGPTLIGEFVVFALLGFVGLAGFAFAFRRSYPSVPWSRYLRWIWLLPSLWFWPSSVGKEAILLLGFGLAVAAYIGKRDRILWPLLGVGLVVVFWVRPHLAAIVLLSLMVAQWFGFGGRWTLGKAVQAIFLLVLGVVGAWMSLQAIGVGEFDAEGVQEYVVTDPARSTTDGTNVAPVSPGLRGIPMAAFNVLFRPFPWEATNIMVVFSSLEIVALWAIVLARRRNLFHSLRRWRSDRFVRLAVVFVLLYSVALGMVVVNLGIIARQRIFLFPFIFLLLEATPPNRAHVVSQRPSSRGRDSISAVRFSVRLG